MNKRKTISGFDIEKIIFEEAYESNKYRTITLYFIAPKEWIEDAYPEAESSEISVELPIESKEAMYATVMMSPTKDGYDYDWFDVELSYEDIEKLLILAEKKTKE